MARGRRRKAENRKNRRCGNTDGARQALHSDHRCVGTRLLSRLSEPASGLPQGGLRQAAELGFCATKLSARRLIAARRQIWPSGSAKRILIAPPPAFGAEGYFE